MKPQLSLRIVVDDPPPGAMFAVQQGRSEFLAPAISTARSLVFEFCVSVADASAQPPRLTGKFAQGPPSSRFVYVNSGTMAGQADSCYTRRAKVPLTSISNALVQAALAHGHTLETHISGRARDGGPACATVPLLSAWAVADGSSSAA